MLLWYLRSREGEGTVAKYDEAHMAWLQKITLAVASSHVLSVMRNKESRL